jgi:hypothetical protein
MTETQKRKAAERAARIKLYRRNIATVYKLATEAERRSGLLWYETAFNEAARLGQAFKLSPLTVSYVIAALSPNNDWTGNLLDAAAVCASFTRGELSALARAFDADKVSGWRARGDKDAFKGLGVKTYPANIAKAERILSGALDVLNGRKVTAFQHNIYFADSRLVTVDTHAASVAHNFRYTAATVCKVLNPRTYDDYAESYAAEADKRGLLPKQIQAITWVSWRRIHAASIGRGRKKGGRG